MSRVYTQEFKEDAVRLLERTSSDLGTRRFLRDGSRRQYKWTLRRTGTRRSPAGKGSKAAAASTRRQPPICETLEEKVKRLERENAQLR